MAQNQQINNSTLPKHLNLITTAVSSSLSSIGCTSERQQTDVYEFHSSPEEDIVTVGGSFFPSIAATTTSIQYKSASTIPGAVGSGFSPAPKRIKTAILAKKLVAAASVENRLIDPYNKLQVQNEPKHQEKEEAGKEGEKEIETFDDINEQFKNVTDEAMEDKDYDEKHHLYQQQRAHSFSCGESQEPKKVPPLRISLIKTPSEEGDVPSASHSPVSTALRKSKRMSSGRVAGNKGHGAKKDDLGRVTRSKVRQFASSNEGDDPEQPNSNKKRRKRTIEAASSACGGNGFFEEEDASSAAEGGPGEDECVLSLGGEDREAGGGDEEMRNNEDSQHSASRSTSNSALAGSAGKAEQTEKEKMDESEPTQPPPLPSAAAILLTKNSLEQSVGYEAMISEKWTKNYKDHLEYVLERVENANSKNFSSTLLPQNPFSSIERNKQNMELRNELPEALDKLFLEQERRRRELLEEHCLDRERIREMAEREISRFEAALVRRARLDDQIDSEKLGGEEKRRLQLFPVVACFRDAFCHDPGLLAQSMQNSCGQRMCITPSINQCKQRFVHLANTTKNRHLLEAQSLVEVQKAEWLRLARKLQREREQQREQQQIMKSLTGSNKKQPPQQKSAFPPDFWIDSAVRIVEIAGAQLPQFQINSL